MTDNAPGWQSDPTGRHEHRYWDGTAWTDNVSDAGVASTDAYTADAAAADVAPPAAAEPAAPGWADPTTTTPAASSDPTSTWPVSPAPPPPPSYTPPAPVTGGPVGPVGSGGSRKGLFIGIGVLAAVAIAVAVLLMGGGDDKSDVRALLASKLQDEEDTLSGDQADCVADLLVDEAGEDAFKDVDFSADDPPEEFISAFIAVGPDEFVDKCGIDESTFTGSTDSGDGESTGDGTYGSDPELDALYDDCKDGDYQACDDLYNQSPSGSEYEDFADTCGDRNEPSGYCVDIYEDGGGDSSSTDGVDLGADFEKQIADAYETSLGLDRDKAECLAGKITDAVNSGDLDEEQAMSEIFNYLSDCDIDMSEISGN
jgi:hypothetical protein